MTDIVKRLNAPPVANHYYSPGQPLEGPVLTERREAAAEIERLRSALVRIQNWYPISVANPRWTIKEIQEFAHAAREAKA